MQNLTISFEDIIRHIRLTYQIPTVLEAIKSQYAIAQAAESAKIAVLEAEIQQEGDRLRFTEKLVKAADTWAWLKKHHLSLEDFEQIARSNILARKLEHHLFADKVERFFYENQLNYVAAATYEVIFDDRDLAMELFYAVQEGEITFPEIARQYIDNLENRCAGGYQGIRQRKDFRPEIASAVFAAKPPEIIMPISTQKGVHLIWVEDILQPQLDENLRQKIQKELFSDWLKQQIQEVEINI